eukprot:869940-Amorphochlora_amoeboformis.AAC.1
MFGRHILPYFPGHFGATMASQPTGTGVHPSARTQIGGSIRSPVTTGSVLPAIIGSPVTNGCVLPVGATPSVVEDPGIGKQFGSATMGPSHPTGGAGVHSSGRTQIGGPVPRGPMFNIGATAGHPPVTSVYRRCPPAFVNSSSGVTQSTTLNVSAAQTNHPWLDKNGKQRTTKAKKPIFITWKFTVAPTSFLRVDFKIHAHEKHGWDHTSLPQKRFLVPACKERGIKFPGIRNPNKYEHHVPALTAFDELRGMSCNASTGAGRWNVNGYARMFMGIVHPDVRELFRCRNHPLTSAQKDSKAVTAKPWDAAFHKLADVFNDQEWDVANPFVEITYRDLDPSDTKVIPATASKLADKWREFRAQWEIVMHNCTKSGQMKSIEDFTRRQDIIFLYKLLERPENGEIMTSVKAPFTPEAESGADSVYVTSSRRNKKRKLQCLIDDQRDSVSGRSSRTDLRADLSGGRTYYTDDMMQIVKNKEQLAYDMLQREREVKEQSYDTLQREREISNIDHMSTLLERIEKYESKLESEKNPAKRARIEKILDKYNVLYEKFNK